MSEYNYHWTGNKDGISFADAVKIFHLERNIAAAKLESAGYPISNDDEILTLHQFWILERESFGISSFFDCLEEKRKKKETEKDNNMLKYMNYLSVYGSPIIGLNNHKVEPKTTLRKRLEEIAECPTEHFQFDGAMCYSRVFPSVEVVLEHKCQSCGTTYKYKDMGYDHIKNTDKYAKEEYDIDRYVKEIKALGYDVFVEHMCEKCYLEKYRENQNGLSISVLHFRHLNDETYIINTVDSHDCMILAEFLKGNVVYKGEQDETIWINKYRSALERLLGIKIEE